MYVSSPAYGRLENDVIADGSTSDAFNDFFWLQSCIASQG